MLKRRRRIAKYINVLKKKKQLLTKEDINKLKLEENEGSQGEADRRTILMKKGTSIPRIDFSLEQKGQQLQDALWNDSDEQKLSLPQKNKFKKLQIDEQPTERQYEQRLRRFYNSKYGLHNWATQGKGEQEQDLTDLLNHQQIYAQSQRSTQPVKVNFFGRSTEKHSSVITGVDFRNNIVASCGLDQKLKLWSVNWQQTNPQLRVKLQKDVYTDKYSLTSCYFRSGEIILGTLRQNYLVVDYQKWKIKHIGSSFLNQHPRFQNLRANQDRSQILIFSQNKISLIDHKNTYQGSLLAGQPLSDVQFGQGHNVFGVSNDVVYQWDTRNWKLVESKRDCLGYTKLWTHEDTVAIGSKLGIVRLGTISQGLKEYAEISNLVTHVTSLEGTSKGNLLVQCSKWKPNAIRLIDTLKGRCISGFPTTATKVGLPTAASFSCQETLCIGNSQGYLTFFDIKNI